MYGDGGRDSERHRRRHELITTLKHLTKMGFIVGKKQAQPVEKTVKGKSEYITVGTETPVVEDEKIADEVNEVAEVPVVGEGNSESEEQDVQTVPVRRKKGGKSYGKAKG